MARRKIEKVYGFKLDRYARERIRRVFVIGAGGNGSHLVPNLARLVSSLGRDIEIILLDGDKVEEKNLIRQHFISTDVGTNKAEALARRYASAFNVNMGHLPEYLTSSNISDTLGRQVQGRLVITCTDNLKSRKLVSEQSNITWIDLGNEETSGQVSFSHIFHRSAWRDIEVTDRGIFPIPHVFELFPDYSERALKEKSIEELSCAEIAEQSPEQTGFVNHTCAALAINYVHALLTGRPISNHMTFFSIDNTFEHRSITKTLVNKWRKDFDRFKNVYPS